MKHNRIKLELNVEELERALDPISSFYGAANQCSGTMPPPPPYMPPGWVRNKQLVIPLDNYTKDGDLTLGQILSAVAAVNGGKRPKVSNQIRANGKLVQVTLTLPVTAAAAAIAAINATPGVSTIALRPTPFNPANLELETLTGLAWNGTFTNGGQELRVEAVDPLDPEGRVVRMGSLTSAGFVAGNAVTSEYTLLRVRMLNRGFVTFTWAAGKILTLDFTGPQGDLPILFENEFILHAVAQNPAGSVENSMDGLISVAGRFYPETHIVLGQNFVTSSSYEEPFTRALL